MKTIVKDGLAALALAGGMAFAGNAMAEPYDNFSAGSHEAYLIQHCTYNPCAIDYTTMPNWASNPINREPNVRVYEHPVYDENAPYSPDEDQYPPEEDQNNGGEE